MFLEGRRSSLPYVGSSGASSSGYLLGVMGDSFSLLYAWEQVAHEGVVYLFVGTSHARLFRFEPKMKRERHHKDITFIGFPSCISRSFYQVSIHARFSTIFVSQADDEREEKYFHDVYPRCVAFPSNNIPVDCASLGDESCSGG